MSKKVTGAGKRRRPFLKGVVAGLVVAAVLFIGIDKAMGPFSSNEFCISCHEMEAVGQSWSQSRHHTNAAGIRVSCVSCHLPSQDNYATHLATKAWTGVHHLCVHNFGEYDESSSRKRAIQALPDERCLQCHSNLLGSPSSEPVAKVHQAALEKGRQGGYGCLICHDSLHSPPRLTPEPRQYDEAVNSYCYVCHVNFKQESLALTHKNANVGCVKCHGESDAHSADEDHVAPPDIMYNKADVNKMCMNSDCHPPARLKEQIGHRPFWARPDSQRQNCTDCHGAHNIPERHRKWDRTTRELIFKDGYSSGGGGM